MLEGLSVCGDAEGWRVCGDVEGVCAAYGDVDGADEMDGLDVAMSDRCICIPLEG